MSSLPKAFCANEIEPKCQALWEKSRAFVANPESGKKPFCVVMPPPNVTGALHMGHALVNTLQDIMVRWHRMQGEEVLWVPGTDHAGIATQTVVERHLIEKEGKRRKEYAREEFLSHVWNWKEKSHTHIKGQLLKLGCSCDWSRERFTMDEKASLAVRTCFKKLFDSGLIYRGDYLVNWDPVTQTALADDEVEYEERAGKLYHIRYPLADGSGHLVIATTRPETMLGDTAVAVSPKDPRYEGFVGKEILLPLTGRKIPIIEDRHVDREFGTGALKVTPAHDPNDYQIGLRHNLPLLNIMTPNGKINEQGGEFAGLTMEEARERVATALQEAGHLEKVEPHQHRVGVSYRSKAVIEPYLSKQWFVRMEPFQEGMRKSVESGKVEISPKQWQKVYFHWIEGLRDWCISRQLWWGHQIPIWYHKDDPEKMLCYAGEGLPPEVEAAPEEWEQDPDVLDTWFSSALWPFSSLGWPEKNTDLDAFYPNSMMITGHDILFFWVARMIMMGSYLCGRVPFPKVFLNGLIYGKSYWRQAPGEPVRYVTEEEREAYDLGKPLPPDVRFVWEKMSKSKGNVLDPLEMIEEYGTDAVRMALAASTTGSAQIDLERRRFEEFKNFSNKVWNGARFVLMNLEGMTGERFSEGLEHSQFSLEDRWILSSLQQCVEEVQKHLESYRFDLAAKEAYEFFWNSFCSFYVEIAKPALRDRDPQKQKLLVIVLSQALRLLHPLAPFVTEELFGVLRSTLGEVQVVEGVDPYTKEAVEALSSSLCATAPYPKVLVPEDIDAAINESFSQVSQVVYAVRNIRGEMQIPPSKETDLYIVGKELAFLEKNQSVIHALVKLGALHFTQSPPTLGPCATAVVDNLELIVPLPEEMMEKERARLEKESVQLEKAIGQTTAQLNNQKFVERAPKPLVEERRTFLANKERELRAIREKLAKLG